MIKLEDLHIGDKVILKSGKTGTIVKLQSISYINFIKGKKKKYTINEEKNNMYIYDIITIYSPSYDKVISVELSDIYDIIHNMLNEEDKKQNKFMVYLKLAFQKLFG